VKYGILFLIVSGVFAYYGYLIGGWGWLLWWPALSFLIVACGYLGLGAKIFGKRTNGTIAWYVFPYLLPYLLYTWAIWHLSRILRREDCYNEISPGIYVGRRVLGYELPRDVKAIVDLTAEFPEPAGVRVGRQYLCLPTLDAEVPTDGKFKALLETVMRISEPMYIHCAEGHGRSGTLAAAVLLLKGLAKEVEEAVIKLQAMRPGIRLKDAQKALVSRVCPDLLKERAEPLPLATPSAEKRSGGQGPQKAER
jgi:protein-tyrosine phosphatase